MPSPLSPQTMSVDDFATMLAYLVRVCWSAAAGQLHLASISESHPPSPGQPPTRGQQEATRPEGGGSQATQLQAGLCLRQEAGSVSSKVPLHTTFPQHNLHLSHHSPQNAAIAREALELLVTCLKLRSHLLNMFYTLPHIGDFIIDILLGSPHTDIRLSVVEQLYQLCSISTGETEIT